MDCQKENSFFCKDLDKSNCSDPVVKSICPSVCGYDVESTLIKTNCSSNTTDSIVTTPKPMSCEEELNCKNEGTFNPNDCTCKCLPAWSGSCKDFDRN